MVFVRMGIEDGFGVHAGRYHVQGVVGEVDDEVIVHQDAAMPAAQAVLAYSACGACAHKLYFQGFVFYEVFYCFGDLALQRGACRRQCSGCTDSEKCSSVHNRHKYSDYF